MSPLILLTLIVSTPLVLAVLLRVKPLYLFVSIVTGYFWMTFLGETAELTFGSMVHISNSDSVVRAALLSIPLLITLIIMRKGLSTSALPFQFILIVANCLMYAAFLLPVLTDGTRGAIYQTQIGDIFRQSTDVLIAGVAGLHCVVMWVLKPRHRKHHK